MSDPTCTHHNDQQRTECPVCLVAALTAERDQLRSDCENETKWAAHYLAQSIAEKARAERAEAVLSDPQQLHAHCLRSLNEGQIAHLFGERMTEIVNRAKKSEADLATERAKVRTLRNALESVGDVWHTSHETNPFRAGDVMLGIAEKALGGTEGRE